MSTDLQSQLETLIAKCECTIRRGDLDEPATLHTVQHYLVTARDAPTHTATEQNAYTAIQVYIENVPPDIRHTELHTLTKHLEQLCTSLQIEDLQDHFTAGDTTSSTSTSTSLS